MAKSRYFIDQIKLVLLLTVITLTTSKSPMISYWLWVHNLRGLFDFKVTVKQTFKSHDVISFCFRGVSPVKTSN